MSWVAAAPGRSSLVEEAPAAAPGAGPGKQTRSERLPERGHARRSDADAEENSAEQPVHTVDAVGSVVDVEQLRSQLDDAIAQRRAARVLAIVRDMDTARRCEVALRLDELATFMSAREILMIAGWSEASLAATVRAALASSPPIKREVLRAFLLDIRPYQLHAALKDRDLVEALRARFPGSPVELLPQIADAGTLFSAAILEWLIDTSSPKLVARLLLRLPRSVVETQTAVLDELGAKGWAWLAKLDATLVAAADPQTLAVYRAHAQQQAASDEASAVGGPGDRQIARWQAHATPSARALRAQRRQVIASSSVLEIQAKTEAAGLGATEQFAWILDKPGLTAAQLREATLAIDTETIAFTAALADTLRRKFAGVPVEQLFSGALPVDLLQMAVMQAPLARWLLGGAEPETVLRIVAADASMIGSWCAMLDALGIGYHWVRALGGNFDDRLLRRFALGCPDAATRTYIEQRLLGDAPAIGHDTVVAPQDAPATSSATRLGRDLDAGTAELAQQKRSANKDQREVVEAKVGRTIAADVGELSALELEALRHDGRRLGQVLATANAQTFMRIAARLQLELATIAAYATANNVIPAQLVLATQQRTLREIVAALSSIMLVRRLAEALAPFGPFELHPSVATPAVLVPVLQHNPTMISWLLVSDPIAVIEALAAPQVIELAVRALGELNDLGRLSAWPDGTALPPATRRALEALHARATGDVRAALAAKLDDDVVDVPPTHDEDYDPATRSSNPAAETANASAAAQAMQQGGPFRETLDALLNDGARAPTVLALCQAHQAEWQVVATDQVRVRKLHALRLSPALAFPSVPLGALLPHPKLHAWIVDTMPAVDVLDALDAAPDAVVAMLLDADSEAGGRLLAMLPRGRALTGNQKALLHRVARKLPERIAALFPIVFDTPVEGFAARDIERLWATLETVPHAHVDQQSIAKFVGMPASSQASSTSAAGLYRPDTRSVELAAAPEGATTSAYDNAISMSESEAIEALGSQAELARFIATGQITKLADGTFRFVPNTNIPLFPATVLHETGHAVDYMLGARTELVYALAGWKRFNANDFDRWAEDLGSWERVTAGDQAEIRKVWLSWLRGGGKGTVSDLVAGTHPAVAERYAGVGIVEAASLRISTFHPVQQRYTMAQHRTQEFFTLSPKGYLAAPSAYALSAPEEYFAECYTNYYRESDGTPRTTDKKGVTLASWIKTWFDAHVDRVGHNPKR